MKFKYTSLGANNQKLEGILDAASIDDAREELHKMNLSVIAINEVSEEEAAALQAQQKQQAEAAAAQEAQPAATETTPGTPATPATAITTYYFSAQDPQQKEVNGTIDAKDPQSAFARLITEYQFAVLDLYPDGSPDPATASLKGQFDQWRQELEEEGVDLTVKQTTGVKDEEEEEEMSEEIVAEIDQFIINTKKILQGHKNQYSEAFFAEIEKTLDELERIRASNNLRHITKICNNLYELIAHPDNLQVPEAPTQSSQEYETIVSDLKGSGFVSNQFAFMQAHSLKKKSARFDKVQQTFAKILSKLNKNKGNALSQNLASKKKSRHAKWISSLTKTLKTGKEAPTHPTLKNVISKFFEWVKAPNTILRRARKQEMIATFNDWKKYRKTAKVRKATEKASGKMTEAGPREAHDFSNVFMEVDSFVGWLLFFYILYFFLASFALEKDIGLPQEIVLKTFETPLLINISILLILAHLAFTLKLRFFRGQALSSLFLFFLSFGVYAILIVNF